MFKVRERRGASWHSEWSNTNVSNMSSHFLWTQQGQKWFNRKQEHEASWLFFFFFKPVGPKARDVIQFAFNINNVHTLCHLLRILKNLALNPNIPLNKGWDFSDTEKNFSWTLRTFKFPFQHSSYERGMERVAQARDRRSFVSFGRINLCCLCLQNCVSNNRYSCVAFQSIQSCCVTFQTADTVSK